MSDIDAYDYDPGRLKALKPCCARVLTNHSQGTGFAVGNGLLLTCNHVAKAERATCRFGDAGNEAEFSVLRRDAHADLCLLQPVDSQRTFQSARLAAPTGALRNWWAWGFPAILNGQGVPLFGRVLDPDYLYNGLRTIQLWAVNLQGDDAQLGGFSGSPVLRGNEVFGVIYRVAAGRQDMQQARLGIVYAVPVMGYPLSQGTSLAGEASPPPPEATPDIEEAKQLEFLSSLHYASRPRDVLAAVEEWRNDADTRLPPNVPLIAAEKLIGMGDARRALSVLDTAEHDARAAQLKGLALSLLGRHDDARVILGTLPRSAETGGISAGILKRRYLQTKQPAWLEAAFAEYNTTYEETQDAYPGVNAATLSLWLGDGETSRRIASQVLEQLGPKPMRDRNHWDWACIGEASFLLGKFQDSIDAYRKAIAGQPSHSRDIAVMGTQLRMTSPLVAVPNSERERLEQLLPVGRVACFSGHRVDEPGRAEPRFPPERVPAVASRIRVTLDEHDVRFGFSSAASGGDILFLEQLLDRGGMATVFLPFPAEEFVKTSVSPAWRKRFESVLAKVGDDQTHVLLDRKPEVRNAEDAAYAACNEKIMEAALEAGGIYGQKPLFIAVLSAAESRGPGLVGGTAEAARSWKERLGEIVEIDPNAG